MNRGNIPGFYYDEEKRKYFKVQANHIAPSRAKYAHSRVVQDGKTSKKIKREQEETRQRQSQTVTHPPIFSHPTLADSGLWRELGMKDVSAAFRRWHWYELSGSGLKTRKLSLSASAVELLDVVNLSRSGITLAAFLHTGDVASVEISRCSHTENTELDSKLNSWARLAAFGSPIVSINASHISGSHDGNHRVLVCAQKPAIPGNVYFGVVSTDLARNPRGFYLKLGSASNFLWASSMQKDTSWSAIGGDRHAYILNDNGEVTSRLEIHGESRDIGWLNNHTVCFGQNGSGTSRGVMLWDIRSQGSALRFSHHWPVTGIRTFDDGVRVIASENRQICLYDLRSHKHPVARHRHVHHGSKLHFDLLSQDLIAAVDIDNVVRLYTSEHYGSAPLVLRCQSTQQQHIINLRSVNDVQFQACQGTTFLNWNAQSRG